MQSKWFIQLSIFAAKGALSQPSINMGDEPQTCQKTYHKDKNQIAIYKYNNCFVSNVYISKNTVREETEKKNSK